MKVIAHRGASEIAPENTIPAFAMAWEEGADGVECDVRLTADGEVVCIHDTETERVGDRNLVVAARSYADLLDLDVGAWKGAEFQDVRIPLLSELLAMSPPGKQVFVEVKTGLEILSPLLDVFDASSIDLKAVTVIAFDLEVVRALKQQRPDLCMYWLIDVESDEAGHSLSHIKKVIEQANVLGCEGLGLCSHPSLDDRMVESFFEAGLELNIWTVDDPADARRYASLGVTSISSNCPQEMRDAITG